MKAETEISQASQMRLVQNRLENTRPGFEATRDKWFLPKPFLAKIVILTVVVTPSKNETALNVPSS